MPSSIADQITLRLRSHANPERARQTAKFLQNQPGGYGEGDRCLGLPVPMVRSVSREFRTTPHREIVPLVQSPWHEERMCGFYLWIEAWKRASSVRGRDETLRGELVELLWAHVEHLDNWDLVDTVAPILPGEWLLEHPDPDRIRRMAASNRLWDRRVAVLSQFAAVRAGRFDSMIELCRLLLRDPHDLMHKACGWMLREVGKREIAHLRQFLSEHAHEMPRTMLRYSIEKLEPTERTLWMSVR